LNDQKRPTILIAPHATCARARAKSRNVLNIRRCSKFQRSRFDVRSSAFDVRLDVQL